MTDPTQTEREVMVCYVCGKATLDYISQTGPAGAITRHPFGHPLCKREASEGSD